MNINDSYNEWILTARTSTDIVTAMKEFKKLHALDGMTDDDMPLGDNYIYCRFVVPAGTKVALLALLAFGTPYSSTECDYFRANAFRSPDK